MTRPALSAVTVALPEPPDLIGEAGEDDLVWREEDGGLLGRGVAARVELPDGLADPASTLRVSDALASIAVKDEVGLPGTGPVAMGALPFDPRAPGVLVVPRLVIGRRGDRGWVTTVTGSGLESSGALPVGRRAVASPPDEFTLVPSMSQSEWMDVVAEAVEVLERSELRKVVLARRVDISANRPFVVSDVLERLQALYPSCMIFSINGFVGASPELLIRRTGTDVESHPLAGTVARSGDAHGDEALVARLMGSAKARREHAVVVEAIASALRPLCSELDVPETPSVLGLRNVSHLASHIEGKLARGGPADADRAASPASALELVAVVHPTPAVGGQPAEAALHYLQKVEGFDRGFYAGPVGWMDARGDGAWALGIRSAEVEGSRARIFAGNGIVSGSDPRDELAETQLKLQALLAALVRP